MADTAMTLFWSLAYACMVIYSFIYRKEKEPFMPLIAGTLNFGWEIQAFITSGGYWETYLPGLQTKNPLLFL